MMQDPEDSADQIATVLANPELSDGSKIALLAELVTELRIKALKQYHEIVNLRSNTVSAKFDFPLNGEEFLLRMMKLNETLHEEYKDKIK